MSTLRDGLAENRESKQEAKEHKHANNAAEKHEETKAQHQELDQKKHKDARYDERDLRDEIAEDVAIADSKEV